MFINDALHAVTAIPRLIVLSCFRFLFKLSTNKRMLEEDKHQRLAPLRQQAVLRIIVTIRAYLPITKRTLRARRTATASRITVSTSRPLKFQSTSTFHLPT